MLTTKYEPPWECEHCARYHEFRACKFYVPTEDFVFTCARHKAQLNVVRRGWMRFDIWAKRTFYKAQVRWYLIRGYFKDRIRMGR